MKKIKQFLVALLSLIMLFFIATPTNAKHVRIHYHVHIVEKVKIKRHVHKRYKKINRKRIKKSRKKKQKHVKSDIPTTPRFSQRDFNNINEDRESNGLLPLKYDPELQKIANYRVLLAYKAWRNGWNSHGEDGNTQNVDQLAFDPNGQYYAPDIDRIGENNSLSYPSSEPITCSMVDGNMNYFKPLKVDNLKDIIDTNNDIYMNHDVGLNGQSGHRNTILDPDSNAVGLAIYQKNDLFVQDEVIGNNLIY